MNPERKGRALIWGGRCCANRPLWGGRRVAPPENGRLAASRCRLLGYFGGATKEPQASIRFCETYVSDNTHFDCTWFGGQPSKGRVLACCLCLPFKPAFACTSLNADLGISICAADTSWELREAEGDSYVFYNTPEDFAARVVFYDGGTDDGLDSARAARLIAESDGKETDDFAILKMGQVASGNVIYAARASREGVSFLYVNTISVGPSKTMRISTWRRGDAMSDRDREVHISFGRLLKSDR